MRPVRLLGRFREEVLYREDVLLEEDGRLEEAVMVEAEFLWYFWKGNIFGQKWSFETKDFFNTLLLVHDEVVKS